MKQLKKKRNLDLIPIHKIKKLVEKTINKNHKTHQDPWLVDSRKTVGKLISKIPMQQKVINDRFECWEYHYDKHGSWWRYLYTLILKDK